MNISDVIIHIKETLNPDARSALENSMRKVEGVNSAKFNPGKDHLFLVAYDTEKTTAAALLAKVRADGWSAQLVGM